MSFPYYLDVIFGSEESTVDSLGRLSFGDSNGGGGSCGNKTNSFFVSTLIYDFFQYQSSPNAEDINNRFILELDPFVVGDKQGICTLSMNLYDSSTGNRASKSILDSLTFEFMAYNDSSDRNKFKIECHILQGGEMIAGGSISQSKYDFWPILSLNGISINGSYYNLDINGLITLVNTDGSVEYNNNLYIQVDNTELGYTKKNYNYVTNIHLENISFTIVDPTKEEEMMAWWNSKPTFSSEPYPLTEMGGTLLVTNPQLPEGVVIDPYITFNSLVATINLVDENDGHVYSTISGDIVYDTPSEGVLPLSLPRYMMAPTW